MNPDKFSSPVHLFDKVADTEEHNLLMRQKNECKITMPTDEIPWILTGKKKIIRVDSTKSEVGDTITLLNEIEPIKIKVIKVIHFKSVEEIFSAYDWKDIHPHCKSREEALDRSTHMTTIEFTLIK